MPNSTYLSLMADVVVPKGLWPEPWFTLPEAYITAPSQDATAREAKEAAHAGSTMPLFNILGEDFREVPGRHRCRRRLRRHGRRHHRGKPAAAQQRQQLHAHPSRLWGGLWQVSGLAHCREDAVLHSIYNWEAGFHVVALLAELLMSLQQYDLAL